MTRKKAIEKASKSFSELKDGCYDCFIDGAKWADANPQDVAFDQAAMLKVAIEAMEDSDSAHCTEALKKIEKMKKEFDNGK